MIKLKKYNKKAFLIDDGAILEGRLLKNEFYPDSFGCGFSSQKIRKKDINKILFYNKEDAKKVIKEATKETDQSIPK